MTRTRFSGVLVPVITPFNDDLSPNAGAFVSHCRWMLEQGVDGLAIFGTTSEANSLTVAERKMLLEGLLENGLPADKLMPGTGACSIMDAADLTAHAVSRGCGGVLMLPPFYYKAVDTDGSAVARLPLPHSARCSGADRSGFDRAAGGALSRYRGRPERQFR